jgi:hypothetical protein
MAHTTTPRPIDPDDYDRLLADGWQVVAETPCEDGDVIVTLEHPRRDHSLRVRVG